MKWVVCAPGPSFSVQDVFVGWVEALTELGEQVWTYRLDDRLSFFSQAMLPVPEHDGPDGQKAFRQAVDAEGSYELACEGLQSRLWGINPDVLVLISGYFVAHEMLDFARRRYGTRIVVIHTEQPYELDRELELAAHADLNLINDPTHIDKFRAVAPTVYAPHSYRPSVHHPGSVIESMRSDFAFVGTGFGSRRWFFEQLANSGALDGQDVLLGGNWLGLADDSPLLPWIGAQSTGHSLDNEQTALVYRSTRASINLYRREANAGSDFLGWAMGPREVELAATGTFFLRDPRPEGDSVLSMLPRFSDPGSAAELLRWWLDKRHDTERVSVAAQAREAIADRTFTNAAGHLLAMFDRAPVTP